MKLYIWTGQKPLHDGKKVYRQGDKVMLSETRAKALADMIKEPEETKEPKQPEVPKGVPSGNLADRLAALKKE